MSYLVISSPVLYPEGEGELVLMEKAQDGRLVVYPLSRSADADWGEERWLVLYRSPVFPLPLAGET